MGAAGIGLGAGWHRRRRRGVEKVKKVRKKSISNKINLVGFLVSSTLWTRAIGPAARIRRTLFHECEWHCGVIQKKWRF